MLSANPHCVSGAWKSYGAEARPAKAVASLTAASCRRGPVCKALTAPAPGSLTQLGKSANFQEIGRPQEPANWPPMLKGTRAHDFYSTWDSSIDEDMLDLQLQGLEAVSAAPASISQGVAQERGLKGGPDRPCQDFSVAFCQQPHEQMMAGLDVTLDKQLCVSAVFDGHGVGEHAPQLAQALTLSRLVNNKCLMNALASSSHEATLTDQELVDLIRGWTAYYASIDNDILSSSVAHGHNNGTTALVTVCYNSRLYCSNAGDSRAVLCRDGQAVRISRDHTPALHDERARIIAAAGHGALAWVRNELRVAVTNGNSRRACAVSRAFGDRDFKEAGLIVCEPDVSAVSLRPRRDEFMIAASDGLWCAMCDQEAVEVVGEVIQEAAALRSVPRGVVAQVAAKRLMELARERGSTDDITVIVNLFDW